MSRILQSSIRDRGRLAWHGSLRENYLTWNLDRDKGARNGVALAFVVSLGVFVAAYLFELDPQKTLEIGAITFFLFVLFLWRAVGLQKLKANIAAQPAAGTNLPSTNALRFARWLRDSEHLRAFNRWMVWGLIPALFAFVLVAAGIAIANRAAFDVASSTGAFCGKNGGANANLSEKDEPLEELGVASGLFSTDQFCWPTGLRLLAGHRYRITLDASSGDWFDKSVRTDPGGFGADGFVHILASPLKRWWRENWFQPIGRIGVLGNDEYALAPDVSFDPLCNKPFDPETYQGCKACKTDKSLGEESASAKISDGAAKDLIECWKVPPDRQKLVAHITAKTSGELFVYVNDVVLAWPGMKDYFYKNNRGTATVEVAREIQTMR
jgi:hypothetical protein